MIDILDAQPLFRKRFKVGSEQNVLRFLIADEKASCGIPFAVRAARENVRTTRDVLPEEAWELVNELHLYVEAHASNASGRRNRHDFLSGHCPVSDDQRPAGCLPAAGSCLRLHQVRSTD